jgi:hypothetical protein
MTDKLHATLVVVAANPHSTTFLQTGQSPYMGTPQESQKFRRFLAGRSIVPISRCHHVIICRGIVRVQPHVGDEEVVLVDFSEGVGKHSNREHLRLHSIEGEDIAVVAPIGGKEFRSDSESYPCGTGCEKELTTVHRYLNP